MPIEFDVFCTSRVSVVDSISMEVWFPCMKDICGIWRYAFLVRRPGKEGLSTGSSCSSTTTPASPATILLVLFLEKAVLVSFKKTIVVSLEEIVVLPPETLVLKDAALTDSSTH